MALVPEKTPVAQALATLKFLHPPGGVFEIRVIGPKTATSPLWQGRAGGAKGIVAGWFRNPEKAAAVATNVHAEGIYATLNPCVESLLARANERLKVIYKDGTKDKEISRLRNLLIDIDPIRPAGISSTPEEHKAALAMIWEIQADLEKEGWPDPLVGDSGNGGHLVYPLELENIPENVELLKAVLQALAVRYEPRLRELSLELDQKVFNPARISKLYGTVAAKGENLPERPHRRSQILSLPAERLPVAPELLQKLVESYPPDQSSPARGGEARSGASGARLDNSGQKEGVFDLEAYLRHYGVEVVKVKDHGGGVLHCLEECVFDPDHRSNEAAIGQTAEGKLFYQCFHNSCQGRTWAEARVIISGNDKLTRFLPAALKPQRKKKVTRGGAPPGGPGPPVTEKFTWSDLGNARRLVARHGQDLRYNHLAKKWMHWTGKYWRVDDSGEIVRRAKEVLQGIYQEALEEDDLRRRQDLFKFALQSERANRVRGMICLAESEPGIPVHPSNLDANPWLFNCRNGTIDLQTGELKPHRREDLLTCLAPVAYDPMAECPKWEKFLYEVFGDNENLVTFLWFSLGYALTGDCREQCFWVFWGNGANGKGTLMNCIREIMGSYGMHISTETLMARKSPGEIRNDVAQLDGPRFITASEIDKGRRLGESLVKELTGQDPIRARFLYGENFEFLPQFKLFLATNNKPMIRDQTNAIWRRLKLVEFPMDFKDKPDGDLPLKLRSEQEGILTWLVKGCLNWREHGNLGEPPEVIEATAEYRAEMDQLRDFLEESCIIRPDLTITAADLYQAYTTWAQDNGLDKKERLFQRSFGLALAEKGFKKGKGTGGVRLWRGLALRAVD